MIISVVYLLVRCLLGCLTVLARRQLSKEVGLLVLRHENTLLRRQVSRVRCEPGGRLWLAALSRLVPRCRRGEVLAGSRRRCWPGTGGLPRASETARAVGVPGGRLRRPRSASS